MYENASHPHRYSHSQIHTKKGTHDKKKHVEKRTSILDRIPFAHQRYCPLSVFFFRCRAEHKSQVELLVGATQAPTFRVLNIRMNVSTDYTHLIQRIQST